MRKKFIYRRYGRRCADAYWMAAGVTDCPGASYPSMNIAAYQWAMDPDSNAVTMDMPDVISCSWQDPTVTDECTTSIYRSTLLLLKPPVLQLYSLPEIPDRAHRQLPSLKY
ncbi:MAG: hypothetical protein IPG99_11840 [Ignavibacteria bacterium]|nr:hypothetical protein [Ignavibacteria bacterium]